jgi:glutathione synthase
MIRYLIAADPAESLYPEYDTSLRMMEQALKRNIEVDYLNLDEMDYRQDSHHYLKSLKVKKVLFCDTKKTPFIGFAEERLASVGEYHAIMQRKDPPVDESYRGHAAHFAEAPKHILQINDPKSATQYYEKELVQRYPQYSVPTVYCETFEAVLKAIRAQRDEAVMKPSNLFSGIGVGFFKRDASENEIRAHWDQWKPCFVQPFLPEITTIGDLRVLVVNQRVIGGLLRVPAPGSRLGNLKQGATIAAFRPTERQLEAAAFIAKDLAPLGLHFLGLDFIGDYLTEVNMTCPTGVPQAEIVMNGEPVSERLFDEIEKLRVIQNSLLSGEHI